MKKLLCLLILASAMQTSVFANIEAGTHQYYIHQIITTQNIKYNERSFFNAIYDGNIQLCEMFLKAGMTPDTTYLKVPAMYWAISNNKNDIVKLFIKNGANPNAYYAGMTPLFVAIRSKDTQIVSTLIKNGANVNKEVDFVKPLQYAIEKKQTKIVEELINAGAKTDNEVLIKALKSKDPHITNIVLTRFKYQED